MQPTKTEAIKRFLIASTHTDLANLYSLSMECQVNVAQDGGERIDGTYQGRKWHGWSDGQTTWKSFRIPYKAFSDPEFEDSTIRFDLAAHAEAIGMTGWNWKKRCSQWVAFDFDAIVGHSDKSNTKLTNEELEAVKDAAAKIEWITIRKSTSGQGLHLYVLLDDVPTANHNEHAALARSILGTMTALTGFNFQSKVDICGGNMWVWARKMKGTDGLALVKKGVILKSIPPNWKDHVKVVTGKRRKNLPQNVEATNNGEIFDELCGQYVHVQLDDTHKILIEFLKDSNALWWWDTDHHMLVTHTIHLQKAHKELGYKGYFETSSPATMVDEQNCFAFPMRKGAWAIRRYTPGVSEHASWEQDGAGWTRCFLNREPDISTACRAFGGLEDPSGGFVFREAEIAVKAAALLGISMQIATALRGRKCVLKQHKDGRLVIEVTHDAHDSADDMQGWLVKKNNWTRIYNAQVSTPTEADLGNYDDLVRHLVTETNEDYGWMLKSDNEWRLEPLTHLKIALQSLGYTNKETIGILGSSVFKCWRVVNKPFQPEYPGDREWNRNAAQLKFLPERDLESYHYPTWDSIMNHCGKGLNDAILNNGWAKANGLMSGADYLKIWIASLFQEPTEPLPYLFFYGPQNSGKSIFHEALSLLLTKGYKRADAALISQAGFNGELEGAIICVVEETNLAKSSSAYDRIKDWVTSRDLLIHCKGKTPYHIPNTTHWIQCANNHQACPIFTGDTRITMSYVELLDPLIQIPKKDIIPLLEKEAPHFLGDILNLEIPRSNDRLNVPVIETEDKATAQQFNQSQLELFISEKSEYCNGTCIKFSDFHAEFMKWLDVNDVPKWTKIRVGRELPPQYPKARQHSDGQWYIGNITWHGNKLDEEFAGTKFVARGNYLERVKDDKTNP